MGAKVSARGSGGAAKGAAVGSGADDATRAVLDAVRRIVRALRESSRAAEQAVGIGGAQLFVLHRLAAAPPLSLKELAARTFTHPSSVSVVVSRLVDRGLVARVRGDEDGRRIAISPTATGRALAAKSPAAAQERLVAGLDQLGAAQRRQLADLLGRLIDLMALPGDAPMFFEPAPAGAGKSARNRTGKITDKSAQKKRRVRPA